MFTKDISYLPHEFVYFRESGIINGGLSDDVVFLRQLILDGQVGTAFFLNILCVFEIGSDVHVIMSFSGNSLVLTLL